VIAASKVYFHKLNGQVTNAYDNDTCWNLRDFSINMISTIMGFRNAPIPPKHGANAAVVAPLVELVDDVYHVME
jgi:hypothetical protein